MKQFVSSHLRPLAVGIAAVFSPLALVASAAAIMMLVNLVTKSLRMGSFPDRETLRSFGWNALSYTAILMLAFLIEAYVSGDTMPLVKAAAAYVAGREFPSIYRNIRGKE